MINGRFIAYMVNPPRSSFKNVQARFDEIKCDLDTANYLTPKTLSDDLQNLRLYTADTDGTPVEIEQLQLNITRLLGIIYAITQVANGGMSERVINGFFKVIKNQDTLIPKKKKDDMEFELQPLRSKNVESTDSIEKIAYTDIIEIISRLIYVLDFVRLSATSKQFRNVCGEVILPFPYLVFSPDFILITQNYTNVTFNKLIQANASQSSLSLFSAKNAQALKEMKDIPAIPAEETKSLRVVKPACW